jgi:predicted NBD/HSP70 family sugar kinase
MTKQEGTQNSNILLLVGMLIVVGIGVIGALVYNQQLHIYQNRAAGRNGYTEVEKVSKNNGQSFHNNKDEEVIDDTALPPDPNDPTSVSTNVQTSGQMPISESPDNFNKGNPNVVRNDM